MPPLPYPHQTLKGHQNAHNSGVAGPVMNRNSRIITYSCSSNLLSQLDKENKALDY